MLPPLINSLYGLILLLSSPSPVCLQRFPSMPQWIGMLLPLFHITFLISLPWSLSSPLSLPATCRRAPGLHLPLSRLEINASTPRRVRKRGAIGLGDYFDVCVFECTTTACSSRNQHIQRTSSSGWNACTASRR